MDIAITILVWMSWVLLVLLGSLLLLAHMPYRVYLSIDWDETQLDASAWVGWPGRLLGIMARASFEQQQVALYIMGLRPKSWSLNELKKKRGKKDKKKKKPSNTAWRLYMARMPYKLHAVKRLARWLFISVSLKGRIGFDDPYTTGQVAMALTLVRTAFPSIGQQMKLDYMEPICEGRLNLSMMIWLPRIYVGIIALLLSPQGRAMVGHYLTRPKSAHTAA